MQRKNDESRVLAPTSNSILRTEMVIYIACWPRGSLPFACFSRPRVLFPPPSLGDRGVVLDGYVY